MRPGAAVHYAARDEERDLSSHGKECAVSVARACKQQGYAEFDKVLVSPYLRAQQTWAAISSEFSSSDVVTSDGITPYGQAEDVVEYVSAIAELENLESILLVSHLPLVGYLTAEFVGDISAPMFPTSGLVCIEYNVERRQGEVLWHIHP
jgi:phosphohistidine phosphatase